MAFSRILPKLADDASAAAAADVFPLGSSAGASNRRSMEASWFQLINTVVSVTMGAGLALGTGLLTDNRKERREGRRLLLRLGGDLRSLAAVLTLSNSDEKLIPTALARSCTDRIMTVLSDGVVLTHVDFMTAQKLMALDFWLRLLVDTTSSNAGDEGVLHKLDPSTTSVVRLCLEAIADVSHCEAFRDSVGSGAVSVPSSPSSILKPKDHTPPCEVPE